jgi:hypothetical protein
MRPRLIYRVVVPPMMMMKGITCLLVTASLWENVKANDFSYTEANNILETDTMLLLGPYCQEKLGKT